VLNVEPVCGSVGVGDGVTDTCFVSGVNPPPIGTGFVIDVDPSTVDLEFEPEYEATFRNERAKDSADDWPVLELSNRDKTLL
jgi:hypothetical protein